MSQLLPIGQFSAMTRLSIKSLRHYDSFGLLTPARVDSSSGYRYYDIAQAGRAETIRVLRAIDLPLDEIKSLLTSSPGGVDDALRAHARRLGEDRERLDGMLDTVNSLLAGRERLMTYDVSVQTLPVQRVATVRRTTSQSSVAADVGSMFYAVVSALAGQQPAGAPFLVLHDVIDADTHGDIEACVPVADAVPESGDVRTVDFPAADAAVTKHQGPYSDIPPAYHAVTQWIALQEYEIAGPPRETYLNDPEITDEHALLTQLAIPVRPRSEHAGTT